jgi:hypothetical protein
MDVVEGVRVQPRIFGILDLEVAVGGDTNRVTVFSENGPSDYQMVDALFRLDWAEICGKDIRIRVFRS